MVIVVSDGAAVLEEAEDVKAFSVRVGGDVTRDDLADALSASGAGHLAPDGDDVFILVDWVRAAAAGHVGDDWEGKFAGMLDFARSKGWLAESGGAPAIQAHVERPAS